MLKLHIKRRLADGARAHGRLAAIEASVVALVDDDLLDLADIFARGEPTPLGEIARAEMQRRNLTL